MEYWVAINGKKEGPLQEWDVRSLIEKKELKEEDLIWHSNLDSWTPAGQYPLYESYFKEPASIQELGSNSPESPPALQEPALPQNHYWVRRGFAKVFDLFLYSTAFFCITNALGVPFALDPDYEWLRIIELIPFFFLEGYLLKTFGTTFGKALFDIKIISSAESPLGYQRATLRSAASWFFGMAMGFPPFFLISMFVSYLTTGQRGVTTWDAVGKTTATAPEKIKVKHILSYLGASFLIMFAINLFIFNHPPTYEAYYAIFSEHYPHLIEYLPKKP